MKIIIASMLLIGSILNPVNADVVPERVTIEFYKRIVGVCLATLNYASRSNDSISEALTKESCILYLRSKDTIPDILKDIEKEYVGWFPENMSINIDTIRKNMMRIELWIRVQ